MFGTQNFLEQVASWSRAMQWAFWAGLLTIAFLIWDSTISKIGADWSSQVVTKEQQLIDLQRPTTYTSSVRDAVSSFGIVELPRTKNAGAASLTEAVLDILSKHDVKDDEYTRTKTNRMSSGSLKGIGSSNEHIEQVIGDIRFEASQEDVLHVISELESSPWIDVVSDVRLTKKGGRFIRVDLSVEAWVVATTKQRGKR